MSGLLNIYGDTDRECEDAETATAPSAEHMTGPLMELPRAPADIVPKMDVKRGTTTLGFRFNGGVVIAVDSRASTGQYIASATVMKVMEISKYMVGTMAGGAADCQYWNRVLGRECRLWELRNGERPTVANASKILHNILYSYRHQGLSVGTMVAGFDKHGSHLYYLDNDGARIKGDKFSVGSGSIYAYGVLDQGYSYDMSREEAIALGHRAIYHATHRDAGSGALIQVVLVDENGVNWIQRTDMMETYHHLKSQGGSQAMDVN